MTVENLPHLNASLNLLATILLVVGFVLIRKQNIQAHKWTMISCFLVSCGFLVSYLIYHAHHLSKPFPHADYASIWSVSYYFILSTHIILAAAVPFLAATTIILGLLDKRSLHRKIARWTFPIWLYVSITGVIIYAMLYLLFPPLA